MQKGWYCFCSPEPRVNLASGQCWAACKVECALSGNTHVLQPVLGSQPRDGRMARVRGAGELGQRLAVCAATERVMSSVLRQCGGSYAC